MSLDQAVACDRCHAPLRVSPDRNPDARLLRHSLTTGVCAGCAMTHFLKTMEPLATILREQGPELLLAPAVQAQAGAMLVAAYSDADVREIDWPAVVERWSW